MEYRLALLSFMAAYFVIEGIGLTCVAFGLEVTQNVAFVKLVGILTLTLGFGIMNRTKE